MNILSGFFSEDLAIDLGTVNTIVYTPTEGVVLNEPTIPTTQTRTNRAHLTRLTSPGTPVPFGKECSNRFREDRWCC